MRLDFLIVSHLCRRFEEFLENYWSSVCTGIPKKLVLMSEKEFHSSTIDECACENEDKHSCFIESDEENRSQEWSVSSVVVAYQHSPNERSEVRVYREAALLSEPAFQVGSSSILQLNNECLLWIHSRNPNSPLGNPGSFCFVFCILEHWALWKSEPPQIHRHPRSLQLQRGSGREEASLGERNSSPVPRKKQGISCASCQSKHTPVCLHKQMVTFL